MLNLMCRKFLCGLVCWLGAASLQAQSVPARDLWEFPLAAALQPAALSAEPANGLWNPAVHGLGKDQRLLVGIASLAASSETGVEGHAAGIAWRGSENRVFSLSVARSAIGGIVRTEFDPQAMGEIPYSSLILSGTASAEVLPNVRIGMALRWREGRSDQQTSHALAADLGMTAVVPQLRKLRVGVSSFLWRPGREIEDRPSLLAAADAALFSYGSATDRLPIELRAGYAVSSVNRGTQEHGPYVQGRFERFETSFSYITARTNTATHSYRMRTGIAIRYAQYMAGIGREEGIAGLGPLYQFTLSSGLR